MSPTTYDVVLQLLGDIDTLIVERISATGATTTEFAAALDELEDERRFLDDPSLGTSPRVAAVREILEEIMEGEELEEDDLEGILNDDDLDDAPILAPLPRVRSSVWGRDTGSRAHR